MVLRAWVLPTPSDCAIVGQRRRLDGEAQEFQRTPGAGETYCRDGLGRVTQRRRYSKIASGRGVMRSLVRTLACTVLALAAGMVSYGSAADERSARSEQWAEAAARQAQEAQRSQREARLRWEYERRRSAAHARMPNTLYASTPSNQAHGDLACPVPVDDYARRLYRKALTGQGPSAGVLNAPDLFRSGSSSKRSSGSGVRVFCRSGLGDGKHLPLVVQVHANRRRDQPSDQGVGLASRVDPAQVGNGYDPPRLPVPLGLGAVAAGVRAGDQPLG